MKRIVSVLLTLLVIMIVLGAEYKVYPNPIRSDGNLTIESTDSLLPPIIKVYDNMGRLMIMKDIGYGNRSTVINFSKLRHGKYIIVLENK